jgi:hypothetical protein
VTCDCASHVWFAIYRGRVHVLEGRTAEDALDAFARARGFVDFAASGVRLDNIIGDDADDKNSAAGARGGRDSAARARGRL